MRKRLLAYACSLAAALLFSGNCLAATCANPSAPYPYNGCSLPGVKDGGFPYFVEGVAVSYKETGNGFNIKASYDDSSFLSSLLIAPGDILDITGTSFRLKARVRNGVADGSIKIMGSIDDLGMTRKETLLTADLSGLWNIDANGTLIGFNTANIVCNDFINAYIGGGGCSQSEVIYLALQDAITNGTGKLRTTGEALTTVPLPAAAWLFGTGLLCLAGISRRR